MQCKQRCNGKYSLFRRFLVQKNRGKKRSLKGKKKTEHGECTSKKNKTEKTKAMKTKNSVQKTVLRSAAVLISFVLISFTVSAQGFWIRLLENSSLKDIAIAMVHSPVETEMPAAATDSVTAVLLVNKIQAEIELDTLVVDFSEGHASEYR